MADKRYRPLINSIATENLSLKKSVKILSWNYDYQFEKIFSEYIGTKNLKETQSKLRIHSGYQWTLENDIPIFKLNGTVGFENIDPHETELNPSAFDKTFVTSVLRNYGVVKYSHDNYQSTISFAWETKEHLHLILNEIKDTEILISIGYSFPDLNRDIDMRIIEHIMPSLEEIYIQDPNAYELKGQLENHLKQFGAYMDIPINAIEQTDKFYIPTSLIREKE